MEATGRPYLSTDLPAMIRLLAAGRSAGTPAVLGTGSWNVPMQGLARSVGFRKLYDVAWFVRTTAAE